MRQHVVCRGSARSLASASCGVSEILYMHRQFARETEGGVLVEHALPPGFVKQVVPDAVECFQITTAIGSFGDLGRVGEAGRRGQQLHPGGGA